MNRNMMKLQCARSRFSIFLVLAQILSLKNGGENIGYFAK